MSTATQDVDQPAAAPRAGRPARGDTPLVPAQSIAGRALVTLIAIMTFLASLTAGAAILVVDASDGWRDTIAREVTIQIRPQQQNRDLDGEAQKAADIARGQPGVAAVQVFSKAESERLLEPWLGAGLDFGELPVPRMIVVKASGIPRIDVPALRKLLAEKVPAATLDDHRLWMERLAAMAETLVVGAMLIFALVLTAMMVAVVFATRGAMAGNKEIIDVLHFVGAKDHFVARQFQRHFVRLGLRGGLVGGATAILAFLLLGWLIALWRATPGGDQLEALFGAFEPGLKGYIAIFVIAIGVALLTGAVSRLVVYRHLRGLI